uniref:Uncharacterized protein n=1 Tax=Lepeophtheirus salmonis TaxID=72036 RepID=A0A0K2T671_LEPSM
MEQNSSPFGQSWQLLVNRLPQMVQLLTIHVLTKNLAVGEQLILDDSLPIPPNT